MFSPHDIRCIHNGSPPNQKVVHVSVYSLQQKQIQCFIDPSYVSNMDTNSAASIKTSIHVSPLNQPELGPYTSSIGVQFIAVQPDTSSSKKPQAKRRDLQSKSKVTIKKRIPGSKIPKEKKEKKTAIAKKTKTGKLKTHGTLKKTGDGTLKKKTGDGISKKTKTGAKSIGK